MDLCSSIKLFDFSKEWKDCNFPEFRPKRPIWAHPQGSSSGNQQNKAKTMMDSMMISI